MKVCTKCGASKPASAFYRTRSGRMGACKACTCAAVRRHRRLNDSVREYDRKRAKTPSRRKAARKITLSWRARNPLAYKAHTALNNAVRDGKIKKRPCEVRGCRSKIVHAHHDDYSKPLKVRWRCPLHHHRGHGRRRRTRALKPIR